MLTSVKITNFRRFEQHEIPLKPRTVIVGPNNAGKSTIVETIRLVSLVANRFRSLQYVRVPDWLSDPVGARGVSPSLRDLNTNLRRPFHSYAEPPAIIEASFESGASISVYVGPDEHVFAVVRDTHGSVVISKAQAQHLELSRVAIQPQVAPVASTERILDPETVRRGLDSALAPSHFRNQLYLLGRAPFDRFVKLAETTWPGLQVKGIVGGTADEDYTISLLVRDGPYVGEIASMGHGLQMWLQVMWFLARNEGSPTLVLDEPDVYLHADLQRKLMRLVQSSHQQVIIATHSVEIMAEAEPSDILTVNSSLTRSRWASDLKGVQRVIDAIGGVHNVQLARLANARRCLFVEGDGDFDLLRRLYNVVLRGADALDIVPRLTVGGWDGWQRVVGTAQFLRNSAGGVITAYSIFDSDYHEPSDIVARYEEAASLRVSLHVWQRKEIENYFLVPSCIHRAIVSRLRAAASRPAISDVTVALDTIANGLLSEAIDNCATIYSQRHREVTVGTANAKARSYIARRLTEPDGLLSVVPGKKVIHGLSAWVSSSFRVSIGTTLLARYMAANEVLPEVVEILAAIDGRKAIPSSYVDAWKNRV